MDTQNPTASSKKFFTPEKFSFFALMGVSFFVPLFVIPSSLFQFQFSKSLLVFTGVVLAFALFLMSVIKEGKIETPRSLVFLAGGVVLLVTFISSFLSGSVSSSLVGYGFEIGTFSFVLIMFLFMFMVSNLSRSKERIFYSYLVFFTSFAVLSLYHIARLFFGPDFLSFGVITSTVGNSIGKWNDLGIFFGIGTVLSLVTFEILTLNKLFKFLVFIMFIVSLFFLVVVNFYSIWIVTGLFALTFFVYIFSFNSVYDYQNPTDGEKNPIKNVALRIGTKRVSYYSLVVIIISTFFLISGGSVSNFISSKLNINNSEVRPSWGATLDIAKNTLKHSPLLGAGPNKFLNQWLIYKPVEINQTIFWNTDFSYGIGWLPTFIVTSGVLGLLAWLGFLILFVFVGLKSIFFKDSDSFYRYLAISSFLTSLYLWVMSILYVPSIAIITLTFFFTGLFFAVAYEQGIIKSKTLSFFSHPRLSFLSVLVLIVLLISSITFGYMIFQKAYSSVYLQKGAQALTLGNIDVAENYVLKAIDLSPNDIYFRALAEIDLSRLNKLLAEQDPNATSVPDSVKQKFSQIIGVARANATSAKDKDNTNYQNWLSLGNVYLSVAKVEGAYENAKIAFGEALKRNPKNPSIYISLAQLEISKNDLPKARENILQALNLKNNFIDAYFLLAQVEMQDKNINGAIQSVQAATFIDSANPGNHFQLGVLYYSNGDYLKAAQSFIQAVELAPDYANAKYFLGLSFDKLGRVNDAITVFTDLKKSNPDNQEIIQILKNLQAGKSAIASPSSASDKTKSTTVKPEKRATLPIKEKTPTESQP